MPWIKRNLFFVLSAAVGVVLMGCAGYFLYTGINDNSTSSDEFKQAVSELQNLQSKAPTKENIQIAKEQQQQVRELLTEARNSFAALPAPEQTDERGFKLLLDKSLAQLQEAANKAGVGLSTQYAFSFSAITTKLNFPPQNIHPWTGQIQEIKSICDILFQSKINFLEKIRRVPVGVEEQVGADYLAATSETNQICVTTPYEITFRAFSGEIAAVLDAFQRSKNGFVVKNIDVQPLTGADTTRGNPGAEAVPPPNRFRTPAQPGLPVGSPATILSETPLHVTLVVDVIKLKTP